MMNKAEVNF